MSNKKDNKEIADVFDDSSASLSERATVSQSDRTELAADDLAQSSETHGIEIDTEAVNQIDTLNKPIRPAIGENSHKRRERKPIGTQDRLNFKHEPGFHYRVVNDVNDGDRVNRFIGAGYEIVQDPKAEGGDDRAGADSQMGSAVVRAVGGGLKGVLMRIPQDWYDEDQADKQRRIDEKEAALQRKPPAGAERAIDGQGRYGKVEIGEQTNPHI